MWYQYVYVFKGRLYSFAEELGQVEESGKADLLANTVINIEGLYAYSSVYNVCICVSEQLLIITRALRNASRPNPILSYCSHRRWHWNHSHILLLSSDILANARQMYATVIVFIPFVCTF